MGVSVPDHETHIMYVWLDALTNYLSAIGYPDQSHPKYQAYWPADVHMVGKDILRFHAVYWPAFLMAADLTPPKRIFAHGWWTNKEQKISKSLGNVIDPCALVEEFGRDAVRYFLLREVPFGSDGDFSRSALIGRMNSELANDLGNLVQRTLSMIHKNCHAHVPEKGTVLSEDEALLSSAAALLDQVRSCMDRQAFHDALDSVWHVVRAANAYVDRQAPWVLRKTEPHRMETVLWVLAESIRHVALMLQPFIPDGASRILDQLSVPQGRRTFASYHAREALVPGNSLPVPQGFFHVLLNKRPCDTMFVDSHCHLDFPDFAEEVPATLARAEAAGVTTFLTICTHLSKFQGVLSLAERFSSVWCSVGIHPHETELEDLDTASPLLCMLEIPGWSLLVRRGLIFIMNIVRVLYRNAVPPSY